jgi:hypothetical protein
MTREHSDFERFQAIELDKNSASDDIGCCALYDSAWQLFS